MRVAVISDVHGNLPALHAVASDWGTVDAVWNLGDLVGYGPDPNECVAFVREFPHQISIIGNHDLAALGEIDISEFNLVAASAAIWTQKALGAEATNYLRSLSPSTTIGDVTMVHGSLRDPVWEYLLDAEAANATIRLMTTATCLVGHSHIPLTFGGERNKHLEVRHLVDGERLTLERNRIIINPGSVGQPRDNDPRASYGILDGSDAVPSSFTLHRVAYPVEETQRRMIVANLPFSLAERLAFGR